MILSIRIELPTKFRARSEIVQFSDKSMEEISPNLSKRPRKKQRTIKNSNKKIKIGKNIGDEENIGQ